MLCNASLYKKMKNENLLSHTWICDEYTKRQTDGWTDRPTYIIVNVCRVL